MIQEDYWQILSIIISLIGLFSACIIGILQIIIPRIDQNATEKKHIKGITLMKCESFQRNVYPEFVSLLKTYGKYKAVFDKISFDKESGIISKPTKINPNIYIFLDKIMFLFNEMDSFAAYMLDNSITDETMAFSLQGKAFCDIINEFKIIYDIYIYVDSQAYVSLDRLYRKWSELNVN